MARTLKAIGGPRHGQDIELPDGAGSYVDLASSTCYIVRKMMAPTPAGDILAREVVIHETLVGDDNTTQVGLIDAVMTDWFKGGEVIDAPNSPESPAAGQVPAGGRATRSGLVLPS